MFTADDIKAIRSGTGGAGASSSASSQGFTAADIKKIRSQINMAELNPAPRQTYTAPKISTPAAQQTFAAPKAEATPQQKAVHERVLQLAANSNAPKSTVQELRSGRDFAVVPQANPNAERDAYIADYMKKYPNDPFGKIGAELAYKADSNKALQGAQKLVEATNPIASIYRTEQALADVANKAVNGEVAKPYEVGQHYINKADEARQEFRDMTGNGLASDIALAAGDMLAGAATAGSLGVGLTPYLAATSGIQTAGEDINKGRELIPSVIHGVGSGGLTYLVGGLGGIGQTKLGQNIIGKITSVPAIKKAIDAASPKVAKYLGDSIAKFIARAGSEGFEEWLEYPAQTLLENIVFDDAAPLDVKQWWNNTLVGFGVGGLFETSNIALNRLANAPVTRVQDGVQIENPAQPEAAQGKNVLEPLETEIKAMRERETQAGEALRVSGLVNNEAANKVNRRTRRAVDAMAKKLGVKVMFDSTLSGEQGSYDPDNREIHIALDSSDPIGVVMTHEITHRIKETSPEQYEQLKNLAFEIMQENGSYDNVLASVADAYGNDTALIEDEMVAHFTRVMTEDIATFERLAGVDRNLAQKLLDLLDELLRKAGWDNNANVALDSLFGDINPQRLQSVRNSWAQALQNADAGAVGSGSAKQMFVLAKDPNVIAQAEQMERAGATEEEIWSKFGVARNVEGNWKREIDDSKAEFYSAGDARLMGNPDFARKKELEAKIYFSGEAFTPEEYAELRALSNALRGVPKHGDKLSDYLKHDELYNAIPELAEIPMKTDYGREGTVQGAYNRERGIELYRRSKETLLHEAQHAEQYIEGEAGGANRFIAFSTWLNAAYDAYKDSPQFLALKTPEEKLRFLMTPLMEKTGTSNYLNAAQMFYKSNGGETEARTTAERSQMDKSERKNTTPKTKGEWYRVALNSDAFDILHQIGFTFAESEKICYYIARGGELDAELRGKLDGVRENNEVVPREIQGTFYSSWRDGRNGKESGDRDKLSSRPLDPNAINRNRDILAPLREGLARATAPHPQPTGTRQGGESAISHIGEDGAFEGVRTLLQSASREHDRRARAERDQVATVATPEDMRPPRVNVQDVAKASYRKLVDSGERVSQIAKATNDKVLYPLFNNAKQAKQTAQYNIGVAQTNLSGERIGKSVQDIVGPIKAKGEAYWNAFQDYVYHMHNIDSMTLDTRGAAVLQGFLDELEAANPILNGITVEEAQELRRQPQYREVAGEWINLYRRIQSIHNKPVFGRNVGAEQSREIAGQYLLNHPEFEDLAAEVVGYYRNIINNNVDAGLISAKERDILQQLYPNYVPVMTLRSGVSVNQNDRTARVADVHKRREGNSDLLMPIDEVMARRTLSSVAAQRRNLFGVRLLEQALVNRAMVGRDVQSIEDTNIPYDMNVEEIPDLPNGFRVWVDGKPEVMAVSNELMEAVNSIMPKQSDGNLMERFLGKANNAFKKAVTSHNPFFAITNTIKDLQDATFYTEQNLARFFANYGRAYKEMLTNGEMWQLYQAMGGTGNSYFNYGEGVNLPAERHGIVGAASTIRDRVEALNLITEQAPRLSEFISVIEKGGRSYENIQKALLAAADITTNFGRSGELGQKINRSYVPFFNPGVQGADKLRRHIQNNLTNKQWANLIGRASLVGILPALLNHLMWKDDEEYNLLPDHVKDNYYVFKGNDGIWYRIPKGRATMPIGNAAQRVGRAMQGEEGAFEGYLKSSLEAVAPNNPFTDNLAAPIIQAANNKAWHGGTIEPQRLQKLEEGQRYDEKTDKLSKLIGGVTNTSPKKINYVLDQYSGVYGDVLLPLMTPQAEGVPLVNRFYTDTVTSNRLANDFYNSLEKSEQAFNTNYNPIDKAEYSALSKAAKTLSEYYAKDREINASDMKDSEKRNQSRELAKERNDFLLKALEEAQAARDTAGKTFSGISDADYALAYIAQKEFTKSKDKKAAVDKAVPHLSMAQKQTLYQAFNIAKSAW